MPPKLTSEFVEGALLEKVWDVGNGVLYDLCAANPEHTRDDVIIAKIWLIGRTYAAAIERRRDNVYARFSLRCRDLNQRIDLLAGRHLSPREFDKVLLAFGRA